MGVSGRTALSTIESRLHLNCMAPLTSSHLEVTNPHNVLRIHVPTAPNNRMSKRTTKIWTLGLSTSGQHSVMGMPIEASGLRPRQIQTESSPEGCLATIDALSMAAGAHERQRRRPSPLSRRVFRVSRSCFVSIKCGPVEGVSELSPDS